MYLLIIERYKIYWICVHDSGGAEGVQEAMPSPFEACPAPFGRHLGFTDIKQNAVYI